MKSNAETILEAIEDLHNQEQIVFMATYAIQKTNKESPVARTTELDVQNLGVNEQ